ncbi:MAG: lipid-A-disaccharide synthase-related protein [Vulcanimicrobiaceae bacterium]
MLFVSNGNGEAAIAERVAAGVRAAASAPLTLEHLPLVGEGAGGSALTTVGPRRQLPSGGLVAMGNVRNFARDLRAGFAALLAAQIAFLRTNGRRYACAVAVGDVYALLLALLSGARTVFVGTAKSVYVAPYGPFERRVLRRAARIFVRDRATAERLRSQGVPAEAPGNVIVDLLADDGAAPPGPYLVVLPGSRPAAYRDGVRLASVVRGLGSRRPPVEAFFSVARTLDAERFARALGDDGWTVARDGESFEARTPGTRLVSWNGPLGALLRRSSLVLGQAGTANEQAAACGVPVVALDPGGRLDWYRMRQRGLLGEALALIPSQPDAGAAALADLLADEPRLARMAAAGRERMGGPGGAAAVARAVLALVEGEPA